MSNKGLKVLVPINGSPTVAQGVKIIYKGVDLADICTDMKINMPVEGLITANLTLIIEDIEKIKE